MNGHPVSSAVFVFAQDCRFIAFRLVMERRNSVQRARIWLKHSHNNFPSHYSDLVKSVLPISAFVSGRDQWQRYCQWSWAFLLSVSQRNVVNKRADRQTDRQTDIQTDRQTDRQHVICESLAPTLNVLTMKWVQIFCGAVESECSGSTHTGNRQTVTPNGVQFSARMLSRNWIGVKRLVERNRSREELCPEYQAMCVEMRLFVAWNGNTNTNRKKARTPENPSRNTRGTAVQQHRLVGRIAGTTNKNRTSSNILTHLDQHKHADSLFVTFQRWNLISLPLDLQVVFGIFGWWFSLWVGALCKAISWEWIRELRSLTRIQDDPLILVQPQFESCPSAKLCKTRVKCAHACLYAQENVTYHGRQQAGVVHSGSWTWQRRW